LNRRCGALGRHFGATDGGGGVPAAHLVGGNVHCGKSEGGFGAAKVAGMIGHFNYDAAKSHLVAAGLNFVLPEMPGLIHNPWAGDCAFPKWRATGILKI
jgi:hypothetical protein